jgi:hypothetical protein
MVFTYPFKRLLDLFNGTKRPVCIIYVWYASPNLSGIMLSSLLTRRVIIAVRPDNHVTPMNQFEVNRKAAIFSR